MDSNLFMTWISASIICTLLKQSTDGTSQYGLREGERELCELAVSRAAVYPLDKEITVDGRE